MSLPAYNICYMNCLKHHWDSSKATVYFRLEILYDCYCSHGPPGKSNVPTGSHLFLCDVLTSHCYTPNSNSNCAGAAWSRTAPGFSLHRRYFCGIVSLCSLLQKHVCRKDRTNLDHRHYDQVATKSQWDEDGLFFSPVYKCLYTQMAHYCFKKNIWLNFNMRISCPERY